MSNTADKVSAPEARDIWEIYQHGIDAKSAINLYNEVARNERYYAGSQWENNGGAKFPKITLNFIKRVCQQHIANIRANPLDVVFTSSDWPSDVATDQNVQQQNQKSALFLQNGKKSQDQLLSEAEAEKLSAMYEIDVAPNNINTDMLFLDMLEDCAITGDGIIYTYWDAQAETGQAAKGCVSAELIDNVNFYPADTNQKDVQKQPNIIIARRELVSNVKAEAKRNDVKKDDLELITSDENTSYQAGDMARFENDDKSADKMITLLYMWKDADTGHIMAQKVTKDVIIRKAWDTKLKRYPVAIMNWDTRKNSWHGRSPITGLIPNQRGVNLVNAYSLLYFMQYAFAKPVINNSMVQDQWNNDPMKPLKVNGDPNQAVKYLMPGQVNANMFEFSENLRKATMNLMGADDVSRGDVNPTNSSAYVMVLNQSQVPLQTIKKRFYATVKQFALNWLDMTLQYYDNSRWVAIKDNEGNQFFTSVDIDAIKDKVWNVQINVGPSPDWTLNTAQQANMLLQSGMIDKVAWAQMQDEKTLPQKQKFIAQWKAEAAQQQALQQATQIVQAQAAGQKQAVQGQSQQQIPQMPQRQIVNANQNGGQQ